MAVVGRRGPDSLQASMVFACGVSSLIYISLLCVLTQVQLAFLEQFPKWIFTMCSPASTHKYWSTLPSVLLPWKAKSCKAKLCSNLQRLTSYPKEGNLGPKEDLEGVMGRGRAVPLEERKCPFFHPRPMPMAIRGLWRWSTRCSKEYWSLIEQGGVFSGRLVLFSQCLCNAFSFWNWTSEEMHCVSQAWEALKEVKLTMSWYMKRAARIAIKRVWNRRVSGRAWG